VFEKRGASALLYAKFLPGLNTVAPPLAGVVRMRLWRFLLFDTLGAVLWAGTLLGLGYAFSGEIELLAARVESTGGFAVLIVGGGLAGYIAYKFFARRRFMRELRIARIRADDLKARLDAGENLFIIDLRDTLEFEAEPETIPGAFRMGVEALEQFSDSLPRDREVVLFCT
jgi:hypothetical protein